MDFMMVDSNVRYEFGNKSYALQQTIIMNTSSYPASLESRSYMVRLSGIEKSLANNAHAFVLG